MMISCTHSVSILHLPWCWQLLNNGALFRMVSNGTFGKMKYNKVVKNKVCKRYVSYKRYNNDQLNSSYSYFALTLMEIFCNRRLSLNGLECNLILICCCCSIYNLTECMQCSFQYDINSVSISKWTRWYIRITIEKKIFLIAVTVT